ncbi:TolC family protein [Siphonobacter aquaeclarae]|uniref:Outer membrane protein TolC n=1 Tax=Siphonobacter aquaeclarae TaxID=563176 RepID=A0A1G9IVN2_9BACT|nr:TolC family protein [Siphonobacter aquaeclarae]SDL29389.1 Outer membrane protein TolC [Siphonobacter aquaeclarae]
MKTILSLLILFVAFSEAGAQRRLALSDAESLAIDKNRDLQVARLEAAKTDQQVREAKGYALPLIAGSAQYQYYPLRQVSFLPGSFVGLGDDQLATFRVGGSSAFLGGVTISQPLLQPGIKAGIRAAGLARDISDQAISETRARVVTDVRKAYLLVLITQEQLRLQQQSIQRNEQALKDARALLAQGRASRVDTLRAYVTIENLRPAVIRLTNEVDIAGTVLKRVIGLDDSDVLDLTDSLRYEENPIEEADFYSQAIQSRPEIHRLELTEKLNQAQVSIREADRRPKLSAVGLVQSQAQTNRFQWNSWPVSSFVGLQLNVPIFSGFQQLARISQAEITRQQTATQLANLKEIVRAEVKIARSKAEEARLRIRTQAQTVSVAELGYRITRDRFRQGIASRLDVTDAELSLTQARANYLQAVHDFLNATYELDRATGRVK